MAYDNQGRKTDEKDAKNNTLKWSYDYFGRISTHTDMSGAKVTYLYDNAKQLKSQISDASGDKKQELLYSYDTLGNLTQIEDKTLGKFTTYAWDLAGRRIREKTVQGGVTYQDNHLAYDALGRLRWIGDGRATVTINYDKVGNRTQIKTHVITAASDTAAEAEHDTDRYFKYDAMNRQILADVSATGELGTAGYRIDYDLNGNKVSDTWYGNQVTLVPGTTYTNTVYGPNGDTTYTYTTPNTYSASLGLTTEVYGRDARGRITTIERDGTRVDERFYDGQGRLVQSGKSGLDTGYWRR